VGKTTCAHAVAAAWSGPARYASADTPLPPEPEWIQNEWQLARAQDSPEQPALLILDEVQKVRRWSEVVKAMWDQDRAASQPLRVLLLGSSALLLAEGTAESLAGRFFLHRCTHWPWPECQAAFGFTLQQWLTFGGYPGAAPLVQDENAWRMYVRDALVETAIARDVLALERVTKPALLRQLFALVAHHPAQILSYNKMLGQLHDAGNTTTLAHYLDLLGKAYLVSGLLAFSGSRVRSRSSSPKLVVWNNALVHALDLRSGEQARAESEWYGRLVENAVGAHLLNHLQALPFEVCYWRDGHDEVDYVVRAGDRVWAIEVKSGRSGHGKGMAAFRRAHPRAVPVIVGAGSVTLEEFLAADPAAWLQALG
jgi:predicted AAA+ superfamily ATPase